MSDDPHVDLGGYVLGRLGHEDRAEFERHLAGCPQCRQELDGLSRVAGLLTSAGDRFEVPTDLRERTRAAVARAAGAATVDAPRARRTWRWSLTRGGGALAFAGAAAVALAFVVGQRYEARDRGSLELSPTLSAPGDSSIKGQARVVKTGIGRVIEFRTNELPILPKGEFYELWFVGPATPSPIRTGSPREPSIQTRSGAHTYIRRSRGSGDVSGAERERRTGRRRPAPHRAGGAPLGTESTLKEFL